MISLKEQNKVRAKCITITVFCVIALGFFGCEGCGDPPPGSGGHGPRETPGKIKTDPITGTKGPAPA